MARLERRPRKQTEPNQQSPPRVGLDTRKTRESPGGVRKLNPRRWSSAETACSQGDTEFEHPTRQRPTVTSSSPTLGEITLRHARRAPPRVLPIRRVRCDLSNGTLQRVVALTCPNSTASPNAREGRDVR